MASVFTENLVGTVLDSRYSLEGLVGIGASARVYRATDRRLGRLVAVKVLHASFADDEAFVRRFRREAEALAPLNHPNIVTIYDVNDGANATGNPPYLVTEYLAGGTLLDLLESGVRMSPSQAARLALEAARGLEFAHARGLVHRDIKPANLLFGEDQHVRVGDFGLATVLADFSRTMQGDSPMGSPRYHSPEQARGAKGVLVDGRSDVYSLALVLVEAVTGSVPFTAESWTGQALERLEGSLDAPEDLGPLRPAVKAAGTLGPEDRIDAAGLVKLLEELARTMPRAESLPLDGSRLAAKRPLVDRDPTRHVGLATSAGSDVEGSAATAQPTAVASALTATSLANERAKRGGVFDITLDEVAELSETPVAANGRNSPTGSNTRLKRGSRERPDKARPSLDAPRSSRRFALVALAMLMVGFVAAGIGWSRRTPTHLTPLLRGQTVADARRAAEALHFIMVEAEPAFDDTAAPGIIISQEPADGVRLKERRTIKIVASKGIQPVPVPDLAGLSFDAASGALRALNLRISTPPITEDSETIPVGNVIRWSPLDGAAPGSVITVVVSSGPPTVEVPRLAGLVEADALAALPPGLTAEIVRVANDAPKGSVYQSKPAAGEIVAKGTALKVYVSAGPAFANVPNVINLLPADASAALRKAGFKIGNTIGPADRPVLHTRPLRNTRQRLGSVVTLYTTHEGVPEVPGVAATQTSKPPSAALLPTLSSEPADSTGSTTTAKP